jgi:ubiquinone/menaquinone biosynthesis C-methylase UbiE
MSGSWLHRPLESPRVYDLVQRLLGAGDRTLDGVYSRGFGKSSGIVLDIGSGPVQETPLPRGTLIGVDVNHAYVERYTNGPESADCSLQGVVASAAELPFATESVDECRCVAVLHHLPDTLSRAAISEMVRVTRRGGRIVIWEMLKPSSWSAGPLARLLCALDRGQHLRTGDELATMLLETSKLEWQEERFRYAWPRLHGGQWITVKQ